jgi:hypothetical protein
MVLAPPRVSGGKNAGVFTNHQASGSHHAQQVETVAQIEEFFRYRPPTLYPAENHTTSDNTRRPKKFDTHLDSSLKLLRVVYMPTIEDDLKEIAESALKLASDAGTLPPITEKFPTPHMRKNDIEQSSHRPIVGETQIQDFYNNTTAKFCGVVASTLEFQHPHWSHGNLAWTLEKSKSRGVADAYLQLNKKAVDKAIAPLPVDFQEVTEHFPVLSLWEFKSLIAGSPDVFEAIVQQSASAEDFHWQGCTEGKLCGIAHNGEVGGLYITGSKMGFDAQVETCKSILLSSGPLAIIPGPPSSQLSERAQLHALHITQQVNIVQHFPRH